MTPAITISQDHGGTAIVYYLGYRALAAMGYGARIVGECDSACTLVMMLPNVCAGPGAVMGFHAGSSEFTRALLWASYPPKLRAWLTARGGLTKRLVVARWPDIKTFLKPCEAET